MFQLSDIVLISCSVTTYSLFNDRQRKLIYFLEEKLYTKFSNSKNKLYPQGTGIKTFIEAIMLSTCY